MHGGDFALKIWRYYFYRVRCTIYTDHKSMRYLMDQANLNMRQHRWLNVVKNNDCKILCHPRKAIIMVDALCRKATSTPIRDLCLRMVIISSLLDLIKKAQVEGLKKENWKEKRIRGQISLFDRDSCNY